MSEKLDISVPYVYWSQKWVHSLNFKHLSSQLDIHKCKDTTAGKGNTSTTWKPGDTLTTFLDYWRYVYLSLFLGRSTCCYLYIVGRFSLLSTYPDKLSTWATSRDSIKRYFDRWIWSLYRLLFISCQNKVCWPLDLFYENWE